MIACSRTQSGAGVDWPFPEELKGTDGLRDAWARTCASMPVDAPDHCREMAIQVAFLILQKGGRISVLACRP